MNVEKKTQKKIILLQVCTNKHHTCKNNARAQLDMGQWVYLLLFLNTFSQPSTFLSAVRGNTRRVSVLTQTSSGRHTNRCLNDYCTPLCCTCWFTDAEWNWATVTVRYPTWVCPAVTGQNTCCATSSECRPLTFSLASRRVLIYEKKKKKWTHPCTPLQWVVRGKKKAQFLKMS